MRILLQLCCAPDGTVPLDILLCEGNEVICFFYGHNIHPQEEYERRLCAARQLAEFFRVTLVAPPYDPDRWLWSTRSLAKEPEGGRRCLLCYGLQIEAAVFLAKDLKCDACATTLTISPHKDPESINAIGRRMSLRVGLQWIDRIWRKGGGFVESVAKSKEMGLYRQRYCGCVYSIQHREVSVR